MITLVRPSVALKDSFLRAEREFQAEGLPWHMDLDLNAVAANFAEYVDRLNARVNGHENPGFVPESNFWAILNGECAGDITIRHTLSDSLRIVGGHIGYDTVPSFRNQGVASEMLRLVLPEARKLGLSKVLLTCDDTNTASIKVIEKNGGELKDIRPYLEGSVPKRYYWIKL